MRRFRLLALTALATSLASPALAQDPPPAPAQSAQDADNNEIVVVAGSLRGRVDAPQGPIETLNEEDIAAYGAGSLSELIEALAPQTGSGRGRGGGQPVFLVNGLRVSSFREMRSYPPEAIRQVEVLPEEVAQRYGFSPNQRVVNFILKDNFSSREVEGEYEQPDRGGYSRQELETTYLMIDGASRLNLNVEWNNTSLLTESERDVADPSGNVPDLASDPDPTEYRSLIGDSSSLEATANWTTRLGDGGTSLSLNGTFELDKNLSLQGIDAVALTDPSGDSLYRTFNEDNPLEVFSKTQNYAVGSTLNGSLGDWELTATLDARHVRNDRRTDRRADTRALVAAAAAGGFPIDGVIDLPDAGFDTSQSLTDNATSLVTLSGRPIELPAGEVSTTFDAGYSWNRIRSEDTRNVTVAGSLKRGDLSAGVNVGVPLTSRDYDFLGAVGDFDLNLAFGVNELSDFGTLTDWSVGLNWGLTDRLSLGATYIGADAAPSLSQLGNPITVTPNVPIYDISRNETVLATVTSGGNPFLPAQSQRDWKISFAWDLPILDRSTLTFDYYDNSSKDVSSSFPLLTPEIEAAFPDRVFRDGSGQLVALDQRPVAFASQKAKRIQTGINLSGPFGKARPEAESGGGSQQSRGGFAFATTAPAGGAQGQGAAQGQRGFGGGQFDWAAARERMCAKDPQTGELRPLTADDLEQMPPFMRQRVQGENGEIDQERLAEMRARFCSSDGQTFGGQGGQFNPERFAALRERFCGVDPTTGQQREITEADLEGLPEPMLARLRDENGQIDAEQLAQLRERFCSFDPNGQGAQGQQGQGGAVAGGAPRGGGGGQRGGGFRGGPGGFGPGGGDGRGRWFFNLSHTYEISNEVLVAPGGPLLDLLDGDALGGANPRHGARLSGGIFYRGFGFRYEGRYTGKSRIDGSGQPGSTDLFFNDYATFDVRLFVDLNHQESITESALS